MQHRNEANRSKNSCLLQKIHCAIAAHPFQAPLSPKVRAWPWRMSPLRCSRSKKRVRKVKAWFAPPDTPSG
jgi:hypothetical protein